MTTLNVTAPTPEEAAELRAASQTRATYGDTPEGYVRPSEVTRTLNKLLADAGVDESKFMKNQQVYNYSKKGYGGLDADTYPFISVEKAEAFIRKQYATKTVGIVEVEDEVEENV